MGSPSSGGISLIELLNILERYDIASLGYNTSESTHIMVEAERRVFANRAKFLGDADFIDVPIATLISKDYANLRAASIDSLKKTSSTSVTSGDIAVTGAESEETTHFSVLTKMVWLFPLQPP